MKKICPICKAEYLGGEVFCPVDAARLITPSQIGMTSSVPDDPLVGLELDRYKVIRRVGEGGMGLVYEGLHVAIEKRVAIKVLRDDFSSRPEVVERFRQEAKSASRIGHENIVDISDFGTTPNGQSYFVMEFLEGEDLADRLAREGTLSSEQLYPIAIQCTRALSAAHQKGIVHRDMKPENIFLAKRGDADDFVKIVDFGIAKMSDIETSGAPGRKLTKTGMIFGTPEYMSPEQAAGKGLDHRVDVYAMGVIFYELLTGRVPFVGDTFMGVLTQHMFETPPELLEVNPNVQCDEWLESVIFRCLAKDPDDRYASMDELTEALLDARVGRLEGHTQPGYGDPARPSQRAPRAPRTTAPTVGGVRAGTGGGRSKGLAIGLGVLLVAAGAGGAVMVVNAGNNTENTTDGFDNGPANPETGSPTVENGTEPENTGETAPVGETANGTVGNGTAGDAENGATPEGDTPAPLALTVETSSPGAILTVEGHPELGCEATPCDLSVTPGEELLLTARRGRMRGRATITPTESETVRIVLRAPRRDPSMTAEMGMTEMTGMLGRNPSLMDLKRDPIFE